MFRLASVFAVTLLSLCWQVPVESVYVDIPVQLAVLGDDYFAFGSINGDVQENPLLFSKLTWDRPEFSTAQQEAFATVIRNNGYVKIKVPSHTERTSSPTLQASARARCLAQSAVAEQLQLHLNVGGSISAVEYRVECQSPPSELPADWSQPQQVSVVCRFPETVAPMRLALQPGLEPSGLPEGSTEYPESQDTAQGGGVGSVGKKKIPVKDERSWILKNWIFLVPAGLLVMNLLNPGDTPPAARPGQTATQGSAAPVQAVAAGSGQGAASAGARSRKKR
ncbi:hypothetical protein ABBQ38_004941 [Trebouxia sp. C0009 RCD-2024]